MVLENRQLLNNLKHLRIDLWHELEQNAYSDEILQKIQLLDKITYKIILNQTESQKELNPLLIAGFIFLVDSDRSFSEICEEIGEV